MPEETGMPKYQCHKQVWALKIKDVIEGEDGLDYIVPEDPRYGRVFVSVDYVLNHAPQAGGYYVVYEDGYKSFSPAEAFEAGYTRI